MISIPGTPPEGEIVEIVRRVYGWDMTGRVNYAWGGRCNSVAGSTAFIGELFQVVFQNTVHAVRLIHKAIHHGTGHERWPSSDDARDPMYWKREALVYGSGILEALAPIEAPRCFGIFERDDGTVGLWLEQFRSGRPETWSIDRYALAARHLGRMQGSFLTGRRLPEQPWLARNWLDAYVRRREPDIVFLDDDDLWEHPFARAFFDRSDAEVWRRVWRERARFLEVLATLPQTLTHNDFWARNLFSRSDAATIAIDWAYLGIGALGEDIGNLVATSLLDGFVLPSHARGLLDRTSAGYLRGLRDAGWRGDSQEISLGIKATIAVKFFWMLGHMLRLSTDRRSLLAIEDSVDEPWSQTYGSVWLLNEPGGTTGFSATPRLRVRKIPPTDVDQALERLPRIRQFYERRAAVLRFLADLAEEAEALVAEHRV